MEAGAKMYLENGRVELTNNGQLWTGLRFDAENVLFEDNSTIQGSASVNVWWNGCYIDDCVFNNVQLYGYHATVRIDDCFFNTISSGVSVMWGSYRITQSYFTSCGVISTSFDAYSVIDGCAFEGTNGMWNNETAVEDQSIVRIRVNKTVVDGGSYGISKTGGELVIRCSQFYNCERSALWMKKGSSLSMSTGDYGGYNIFNSNEYNITFLSANNVNLSKGFNQLAEFGTMNIVGTLAGVVCGPDCQAPVIDASVNTWSTDQTPVSPDPQYIHIETLSECFFLPCEIQVIDFSPVAPTSCGAADGGPHITKPQKSLANSQLESRHIENVLGGNLFALKSDSTDVSDPIIYTTSFDGWALDSALIYAATQMEIYDSTKNDLDAISLFHEIFNAEIEIHHPEIEWKLDWARSNMKAAVENLFLQDDLLVENNQINFENPVALYVDVLNLVTHTLLTDTTMRHQFYLELDKVQLFKTLAMPLVARELLDRVDDCSLDSLEQATLNIWLELVDMEISITSQLLTDSTSIDSLNFSVATNEYNSPVDYMGNQFYFGAWINSPTDIDFMQCGEIGYKILKDSDSAKLIIWPQPANNILNVYHNIQDLGNVYIHNVNGSLIFNKAFDFSESPQVTLDLPFDLASGLYTLYISSGSGIASKRILIE